MSIPGFKVNLIKIIRAVGHRKPLGHCHSDRDRSDEITGEEEGGPQRRRLPEAMVNSLGWD